MRIYRYSKYLPIAFFLAAFTFFFIAISCNDDGEDTGRGGNRVDKDIETSFRLATWNVNALFSVNDVSGRAGDLQTFALEINPEIMVIQEITSIDIVRAIRDQMGFSGYHVACSDFNQNDNNRYSSLEVGIISKYSLSNIIEYDQSTDNQPNEGDPAEASLDTPNIQGIEQVGVGRGFLKVEIPDLKLFVYGVHLKSSRGYVGTSDADNAKKRELVTAAIALQINQDKADHPDYTCIVTGDFNVGHSDDLKNGTNLTSDCYENCGSNDLYDETHALLRGGLVGGLSMNNLCGSIMTTTYPSYPGTPIDNIYVSGAGENDYNPAIKATNTYGSDHLPVYADFGEAGDIIIPPDEGDFRIAALLPNPVGQDAGNEEVHLENNTGSAVNLAGWKLVDRADNTFDLSGTIQDGETLVIILSPNTMPLNNNGDDIKLVDTAGSERSFVSYSAADVIEGQLITF